MGMPCGNKGDEGEDVQASVHTCTDSMSVRIYACLRAHGSGGVSGVQRVSDLGKDTSRRVRGRGQW